MSMTPTRKLADWIGENRDRGDARLVKLVCVHLVKGNRLGDELRTCAVPVDFDEEWQSATASKIVEQAADEARTLGSGIQRYAVQAWFDGLERPHGRHVFTVAGAEDLGAISTEGTDDDGIKALLLRHTEFLTQLSTRTMAEQLQFMKGEITSLREENAELRRERIQNFKLIEEVHSQKAQQEIALRREAAKERLFTDGAEKLGLILPMVLNHWAGRKIFPENAANALTLKSFVDSISKENFDKMAGILSGEQMTLLFQLATSVSKPLEDKPTDIARANGVAS